MAHELVEAAQREADRLEEERKIAEERNTYFVDNGLTEGYIGHYVLNDGPGKGQHRPAIVVKAFRDIYGYLNGGANLQVFCDSNPEGQHNDNLPSVMWKTSVMFDQTDAGEGCWHWKEGEDERAEERREAIRAAEIASEAKAAQKGVIKTTPRKQDVRNLTDEELADLPAAARKAEEVRRAKLTVAERKAEDAKRAALIAKEQKAEAKAEAKAAKEAAEA
jgi:Membrane protein involved in colicin uptake